MLEAERLLERESGCDQAGFSQIFANMGKHAYMDNDYDIMFDYWLLLLFPAAGRNPGTME